MFFYKFDLKDGVVDCQMQEENYALSRVEYVNFDISSSLYIVINLQQ